MISNGYVAGDLSLAVSLEVEHGTDNTTKRIKEPLQKKYYKNGLSTSKSIIAAEEIVDFMQKHYINCRFDKLFLETNAQIWTFY